MPIKSGRSRSNMDNVTDTSGSSRKQVSINEKLFKLPSPEEKPRLTGVKCRSCGELFFPKRAKCIKCFAEEMEEVALSQRGKVYSYTIVHHATPGYTGPLPYAVGAVELPGGIVVLSPLTQCHLDQLKIGMDVELVLEKLYEDENGKEVISYKFKPF
jgi:uncharacterized OB-fold protein